jgi:PAS domain S-box-containing protein
VLGTGGILASAWQESQRAAATFRWVSHSQEEIQKINAFYALLVDLESGVRGYVITGNEVFRTEALVKEPRVWTELARLKTMASDSREQRKHVETLSGLVRAKLRFQQDLFRAYAADPTRAQALVRQLKGKELLDAIRGQVEAMQRSEQATLHRRVEANTAASNSKFWSLVASALAACTLCLYMLFRLQRENGKRRQAECTAVRNEARYRSLIENSAFVLYTTDLKGRFTFLSGKWAELTGYTAAESLNQFFTVVIMEDYRESVSAFYYKQLQKNLPETVHEFPILTKDGREKWVEQTVTLVYENGTPTGFQCIVKDISRKKETELLLASVERKLRMEQEEAQQRLQSLLDHIPMGVYIKDLNGRYTLVNRHFTNIMQLDEADIIGKMPIDINRDQEWAKRYMAIDEQIRRTGQPVELEGVIATAAGPRDMFTLKFPLYDGEGRLFATAGALHDITETVRFRKELISARTKAEQAEKVQEEFLANMSHEIRTPMNGIVGMANLMLDTELTAEQRESLKLIKQSSDTLLVLINDILDFSRIKAGRMTLEKKDFSVGEVVNLVVRPLQLQPAGREVKIASHLAPGTPLRVVGDPHRLEQILSNLVSNAMKFTLSGQVQVGVRLAEQQTDRIVLEFEVVDTGIGIASTHLPRIFDWFSRTGTATGHQQLEATGLGLAISKKLIELQGGTIHVSSEVGRGTTFRFRIPYTLSAVQQLVPVSEPGDGHTALSGKRILIVEDNLINQKVCANVLRKVGVVSEIANNGREAVQLLEGGTVFDAIIMDLEMPEMDGYQATAYIRQKLKLQLPILALTASVLRDEKKRCFEVGMNEYLTKPVVPANLFKQLHRFLKTDTTMETQGQGTEPNAQLYSLEYLIDMGGHEYIVELLQLFLDTTPGILEEMRDSALHEQWDATGKLAHKLKSSVAVFQMPRMTEDVAAVEQKAKSRTDLESIPGIIRSLTDQYVLVKPMLEAELEEAKRTSA